MTEAGGDVLLRHLSQRGARWIRVERPCGSRPWTAQVPAPAAAAGDGPVEDLLGELRWYLEAFPDYPRPPATLRAERALFALGRWGAAACSALRLDRFGEVSFASPRLLVRSSDPEILNWPWEALEGKAGPLGLHCRIERQLAGEVPPAAAAPPQRAPGDRGGPHLLLVTARPLAVDLGYRWIGRSVAEAVARHPRATVHSLRPPTMSHLMRHLQERPGHYDVLHFDGHGTYEGGDGGAVEGHLLFETDDGRPEPVAASTLAALLQGAAVPVVVINACRSAMLDRAAGSAFASVATALVGCGTRSVVAMSHALSATAAQQMVPSFYRTLLWTGDASLAALAGRRRLARHRQRVGRTGSFELHDWLVPVLYRRQGVERDIPGPAPAASSTAARSLPRPPVP